MDKGEIVRLFRSFEALVHEVDELEIWFARDLQRLLGYERWENFEAVLERGKEAARQMGWRTGDHFRDATKMVPRGSGAHREVEDVMLTRYACYLLAQNGDPRKVEVAFAQTYFAMQTRKQELVEQRLSEHERLRARAQLAASEKDLSAVIYERTEDEASFARIRSTGDAALFGGRTTQQMKRKLGVPGARPLADFLPTITVKAKDLANEMTTLHVRVRALEDEPSIAREHASNNRELRAALGKRGIRPEDLPAEEDVRKLERRLQSEVERLPRESTRRKEE
ncbi:MAG: DNA damage-inducible protein D [Planctomycetes bacterium]|nr:DNA damage-inducible protein D [Planctomycetota bacterium]